MIDRRLPRSSQQPRRPTGTVRRIGDERPSIQSSIGMQAVRCRIATANGKKVVRPTVPRYDQARTLSKHAWKRTADTHSRSWNAARVAASGAIASTTLARAGRRMGAFATKGQLARPVGPAAERLRRFPITSGPIRTSLLDTCTLIGAPASPRERQPLTTASAGASTVTSGAPTAVYELAARKTAVSPAVTRTCT
jgi:hypothetical protein